MTRRMRERIGTKSNAKGEVRPGDGEYGNQTPRGSPGRLSHQGNRAKMPYGLDFA